MPLRKITKKNVLLAAGCGAALALSAAPAAPAASWTSYVPSKTTTTTTAPAATTTTTSSSSSVVGADGVTCTTQATSKPYLSLGDAADYAPAPGGTFEQGQSGWTFSKKTWPWDEGKVAQIISGNDGNGILPGTKALEVQKDGYAISPRFCVDESHPYFRFSFKVTGWASTFDVLVVYRDLAGNLKDAQFVSSRNVTLFPGQWQVSPVSPLATDIPLVAGGKAASVQLYAKVGNGSVVFDNFLVDPYRTR